MRGGIVDAQWAKNILRGLIAHAQSGKTKM
jgi:hypothetical protein